MWFHVDPHGRRLSGGSHRSRVRYFVDDRMTAWSDDTTLWMTVDNVIQAFLNDLLKASSVIDGVGETLGSVTPRVFTRASLKTSKRRLAEPSKPRGILADGQA